MTLTGSQGFKDSCVTADDGNDHPLYFGNISRTTNQTIALCPAQVATPGTTGQHHKQSRPWPHSHCRTSRDRRHEMEMEDLAASNKGPPMTSLSLCYRALRCQGQQGIGTWASHELASWHSNRCLFGLLMRRGDDLISIRRALRTG